MIAYHVLSPLDDPLQHLPRLTEIYHQAFTPPPYAKSELEVFAFARLFPEQVHRKGFRMVLAERSERVIGFAFGYSTEPEHYWNRFVRGYLSAEEAADWLADAFQFVEIALLPRNQGQGIGGKLHDMLLEGLTHRNALLTTMHADTNAYHLYKHRGWVTLVEDQHPPGIPRAYRTMGLRLK